MDEKVKLNEDVATNNSSDDIDDGNGSRNAESDHENMDDGAPHETGLIGTPKSDSSEEAPAPFTLGVGHVCERCREAKGKSGYWPKCWAHR